MTIFLSLKIGPFLKQYILITVSLPLLLLVPPHFSSHPDPNPFYLSLENKSLQDLGASLPNDGQLGHLLLHMQLETRALGVLVSSYCCPTYRVADPFSSFGTFFTSSIGGPVFHPIDDCEHPTTLIRTTFNWTELQVQRFSPLLRWEQGNIQAGMVQAELRVLHLHLKAASRILASRQLG